MAWSYATGVLTSTGATEASPDSLLAGIDIVEAADATRGYRDGFVAWLNNVRIVYVNSFVKSDDDSAIEFRGTSYFASGGPVGFIGGRRAKLIMNTGTVPGVGTTTTTLGFMTGSTIITQRAKPSDPAFQIIYKNTARLDFPAVVDGTQVLAKADINGLDLFAESLGVANFFRMFFANATVRSLRDIRVFDSSTGLSGSFPRGLNVFLLDGTYDALYRESNDFGSEVGIVNTVTLTKPTFYSTTSDPLVGFIRSATFNVINPSFLNNCWNGAASFSSTNITADSKLSLLYSYTNEFKQGLTTLSGVRVRFTRARQSVNGSPTWTAPGATYTAASDASGTFTPINLLDAYREGTSLTNLERFNWTAKARRYDRRTAGETIFANRVLYRHSVNMSAGYSEEVQMLNVSNITLTEAQAAALTGISFAASGATGGTITISANRSASDLWHYYRWWISQTANFDSNDTWSFDGATLNTGAWNVVVNNGATLTGNLTTTGTVTTTGEFIGSYTDASGTRVTIRASDNAPVSSFVIIDGVPQGWQALQTVRRIFVQPSSVVQIYAHAYGMQPRLITVNGNTASDYVIAFVPEVHVDTTQTDRDTIAAAFGIGVDAFTRIFLSVNTDLRQYTPAQVLHALHYFVLTQAGAVVGPAAIQAGDLNGFGLINGGFAIRTPGFYGKVADSVTTVNNLGILVPLAIYVDPAVYVAVPTYTPVEKNTSGIVLQYAPWTQLQADVNTAQISGSVWTYPTRTITSGGITLAEIEASTVLAKDATVQALANNNQAEHDATQAAIEALPVPPTLPAIRADLERNGGKLDKAMKAAQSAEDQTV